MKIIKGSNVNTLYTSAMRLFMYPKQYTEYPSRNGVMLELNTPVVSVFQKPYQRVLFNSVRNANPFLHFFESLWMLAGRNDLKFMTQFTKNFENYSDDGVILNAAYGHRWRKAFGYDQITDAIQELTNDPMSRRVVTQIWNGDENKKSKDIPCNTSVMWRLRDDVLDMTVTNRSNDAIWGLYGANAVHFSFLHEYVAESLDVQMGTYYHVSNSLHIYRDFEITQRIMAAGEEGLTDELSAYKHRVPHYRLFNGDIERYEFDADLYRFFEAWERKATDVSYQTPFFCEVVNPMWRVFTAYKNKDYPVAFNKCRGIQAADWRAAVGLWLARNTKN